MVDDPGDWIRREIVEAFRLGLRVTPVLTNDVALPAEVDLPQDIAGLSRRQYVPLRRRYAAIDLDFLVERITDADAELAKVATWRRSSASRVPAERRPTPRQLPASPRDFTGRAEQLAALDQLLSDETSTGVGAVVISAVDGTAGVGKPKPGSYLFYVGFLSTLSRAVRPRAGDADTWRSGTIGGREVTTNARPDLHLPIVDHVA